MKLSKGFYIIGDPCYMIGGDDEWDLVLKETKFFGHEATKPCDGSFTITDCDGEKHNISAFNTGGDGGHMGSDGFEYGVDSGTLACIPASFSIRGKLGPLWSGIRCCNNYLSNEDFDCWDLGDTLQFGDIFIEKIWKD